MRHLILALAISMTAFGQAPETEPLGFPPHLERYLMLEPGQADLIVAENEEFRLAARPLREELKELGRRLNEETKAEEPNAATLGLLLVDMEMTRRDIEELRESMQRAVVEDILTTDEQRGRLAALERARRLMPLYDMAHRWSLVDTPKQKRRQGPEEEPPAE